MLKGIIFSIILSTTTGALAGPSSGFSSLLNQLGMSPTKGSLKYFIGKNREGTACFLFAESKINSDQGMGLEVYVNNSIAERGPLVPIIRLHEEARVEATQSGDKVRYAHKYNGYYSAGSPEAGAALGMMGFDLRREANQVIRFQLKNNQISDVVVQTFDSGPIRSWQTLNESTCQNMQEFNRSHFESKEWQRGWPTRGYDNVERMEYELRKYLETIGAL